MKMKRIGSLIALVLVGIMVLSGCSSDAKNEGNVEEDKTYRIGISQLAEHPALDDARKGFEDGLKELGVDVEIDYQNAQGDIPNATSIAQKFVKDEVDLIYAIATPAVQSAKQTTTEIPILFSAVTDPVKSEVVDDWEDVGGNITGTSDMAPTEIQLKMFQEIDPDIRTIGILYNTSENNSEIQIEEIKKLAPSLGLELEIVGVSNVNELPQAVDAIIKRSDALYMLTDNMIAASVELLSKKALENNIITVSAEETQVKGGLLITNGLSYYDLGKQTAKMAMEILVNGKSPSSIPVEVAKQTVTTININTLKSLGLDPDLSVFKDANKIED